MEKKQNENELTGSFALDALTEAERVELLHRAETSPALRSEIRQMQQTAALLGTSVPAVAPPSRLKKNLLEAIRTTEQLPALAQTSAETSSPVTNAAMPVSAPVSAPATDADSPTANKSSKFGQRFFALAAGVLLLAAGGLGVLVWNQAAQQQEMAERLTALTQHQSELTQILAAADVRSAAQTMDNGAKVTLSYSAAEGMMAVSTSGMPALPEDQGYEMWLISADGATSAGMLNKSQTTGLTMISGSMEGVTHFGITVEPASGSIVPTTDPIMLQEL